MRLALLVVLGAGLAMNTAQASLPLAAAFCPRPRDRRDGRRITGG